MFKRFLKTSNYPEFWIAYASQFKHKQENDLNKVRFVIFDTETTGLDVHSDRVLSIGAIGIKSNQVNVSDAFEMYVKQDVFNKDSVEVHGLLKGGKITKYSEVEAVQAFLDYIGNSVLVAHHAAFDVAMINAALKRMELPKLKNKVLDTGILFKKIPLCEDTSKHYSLDFLSRLFKVPAHDRHTASGDALITGIVFLKILASLKQVRSISLSDLFFNSQRRGLM